MRKLIYTVISFFIVGSMSAQIETDSNVVLVIHGGAGTILQKNMTPEKEAAYRQKLEEALFAGFSIIEAKGTSVEAVQSAIHILEDSPLFNAGKGSVYTNKGIQEMDASIMNGKDKSAGAVAGVHRVKNPIDAAIAVMNKSEHVMLAGKGAEEFSKKQGVLLVKKSYFKSEERLKQLEKIKAEEKTQLDHDGTNDKKFGTVGAVALDF